MVLYGFSMINQLQIGFYVTLFAPALFLIIGIFRIKFSTVNHKSPPPPQLHNHLYTLLKPFFSVFLFFFVLYFFLFIINIHKTFMNWDDFSHWGPMVKEMLRLDSLYDVPQSLSIRHKDYPPMIQLIEFFFCKMTGGFSEPACFIAAQSFTLVPLISVIRPSLKTNRSIQTTCSFVLILLLPILIREGIFYKTTLQDISQAIIGGFALYQLVKFFSIEKIENINRIYRIKIVSLTLTLCTVILIKPNGFFYFGIASIILVLVNLTGRATFRQKSIKKIFIFSNLSIVLIPLLTYFSWYLRVSHYHNQDQGSWSLRSILNVITRQVEAWQNQSSNNYIEAIFQQKVVNFQITNLISNPFAISLSYFALFIICLGVAFLMALIAFNKQRAILTILTIFLLGSAWSLLMWISYQTQFTKQEAIELAAYDRYMPSIFAAMSTVLLLRLIEYFNSNSIVRLSFHKVNLSNFTRWPLVTLLFTQTLIIPINNLGDLTPASNNYGYPALKVAGRTIQQSTPLNSRVFIFSQIDPYSVSRQMIGLDYEIFQHNETNIRDRHSIRGGSPIDNQPNQINVREIPSVNPFSPEDLWEVFESSGAKFLYFLDYSEEFYNNYFKIFPQLQPYSLYEIAPNRQFVLIANNQNDIAVNSQNSTMSFSSYSDIQFL
jgi:hypothetical protein